MKTIHQWFAEYGVSHQNPTNKQIHWLCVPAILFSIIGIIAHFSALLTALLLVLTLVFYARLDLVLAVAMAALDVVSDENLAQNARKLGNIFREEIGNYITTSNIATLVRGKGLLNAIVINDTEESETAWNICVRLAEKGLLAKPTHGNIIRFAPPLVMNESQLKDCIAIIIGTLKEFEK